MCLSISSVRQYTTNYSDKHNKDLSLSHNNFIVVVIHQNTEHKAFTY